MKDLKVILEELRGSMDLSLISEKELMECIEKYNVDKNSIEDIVYFVVAHFSKT
jgi:hypothetical protein